MQPEELVTFLQVLRESPEQSAWFLGLRQLPEAPRIAALRQAAAEIAKDHPSVSATLEALTDPALFDAAYRTLQELNED
jgi:hypothetical protein